MTLTVTQTLTQLNKWLVERRPFYHTRWGDGELMCMFGMVGEEGTNCDGHYFYRELGRELLQMVKEVCNDWQSGELANLIVGSNNSTHPDAPWTVRLLDFLTRQQVNLKHVPWAIGDFWWSPYETVEGREEIIQLIDNLRAHHDVVLVCNDRVADARHCMGATHVSIPEKNAWNESARIYNDCWLNANNDSIFVWAAGMPGKSLAWQIKKLRPKSSHIDVGHIFDGPFGLKTRTWHEYADEIGRAHWEFCQDVFNPYVRSFIPYGNT